MDEQKKRNRNNPEILKIGAYGLAILISAYISTYYIIGSDNLLELAEQVRPYAGLYKTDANVAAKRSPDEKVIFFFGDSTVLIGRDKKGRDLPEKLESILKDRYSLKDISIVNRTFGSHTLFHAFCQLYPAMEQNAALVIIPIDFYFLGEEKSGFPKRYNTQMASMIPIREFFHQDEYSPLKSAEIGLPERILYSLDKYVLCGDGMRIWIKDKIGIGITNEEIIEQALRDGAHTFEGRFNFLHERNSKAIMHQDDPPIRMLNCIARKAEEKKLKALFYIVPTRIHLPYMERGDFGIEDFRRSTECIVSACSTSTTRCIDLAELLGKRDFVDGLHFTSKGSSKVANALAPEVVDMLK